MRIRTVDELRTDLRLARQRFSPREIGRATGVSHTTINLLLSDREVPRPTTATIRKLSMWLDANADDAPAVAPALSDHPPGYWQGVAEAVLRMIDAAGVELQSLIDSGVLGPRQATSAGLAAAAAGAAAGTLPNGAGNGASHATAPNSAANGGYAHAGLGGASPDPRIRNVDGHRHLRRVRARGPLFPAGASRYLA